MMPSVLAAADMICSIAWSVCTRARGVFIASSRASLRRPCSTASRAMSIVSRWRTSSSVNSNTPCEPFSGEEGEAMILPHKYISPTRGLVKDSLPLAYYAGADERIIAETVPNDPDPLATARGWQHKTTEHNPRLRTQLRQPD